MSIATDPAEVVVFPAAKEDGSKRTIGVLNNNDFLVAFKFKTTAPKHYSVRPNSGYVKPNSKLDVNVVYSVRDDDKRKDKFLVLSIRCDNEDMDPVEFWTYAESARRSDIQELKLRCEYDPTERRASESFHPANSIPSPPLETERKKLLDEISSLKKDLIAAKELSNLSSPQNSLDLPRKGSTQSQVVVTKTVIDPDAFKLQTVLFVGLAAFILGALLY